MTWAPPKLDTLLAEWAEELRSFVEEVASEAFDQGYYSGWTPDPRRAKLDTLLAEMGRELRNLVEEVASETFDEGYYSGLESSER